MWGVELVHMVRVGGRNEKSQMGSPVSGNMHL